MINTCTHMFSACSCLSSQGTFSGTVSRLRSSLLVWSGTVWLVSGNGGSGSGERGSYSYKTVNTHTLHSHSHTGCVQSCSANAVLQDAVISVGAAVHDRTLRSEISVAGWVLTERMRG